MEDLSKILVALAKVLAIVGVALATIAAIIWIFTTILEATGNFPVAMICVYLIGGLATVIITFILNAASRKSVIAVKTGPTVLTPS